MPKTVLVNILDENNYPTGKTEEVELRDDILHLLNTGKITTNDEAFFFQRQLEYIQSKSYDVLYPDLKGRETFPTNTEGGEGINQITYRSYDKRGEAQVIAGKATDLPRADISGKEYTIDVRTIGNAYGYSRQEIAAAKLVGMPLDARKSEAARRAYEEKINQTIWFGDVPNNLGGLFDGPVGFPQETIPNTEVAGAAGGGNSTVWGVDKTPDEVIYDLSIACSTMFDETKMIHRPNRLLIGVEKFNYLVNTPRSLQSDTSILKWFLANNDFITDRSQITVINELKGIFGANPGAETGDAEGFSVMQDGMDNARIREPFPYVHLPVQYRGLEFEINCYGRFAGLEIIRPQAIGFWYGI